MRIHLLRYPPTVRRLAEAAAGQRRQVRNLGSRPRPGLPVVTADDDREQKSRSVLVVDPQRANLSHKLVLVGILGLGHEQDGMRECRVDAAADHVEVLIAAIAQVPAGHRKKLLMRPDRVPGSPAPHSRPRLGAPPACGGGPDPGRQRLRPGPVPFREYPINTAWMTLVAVAADLISRLPLLALPDALNACEPRALRYRFLHVQLA
jgi:hypothetical protein